MSRLFFAAARGARIEFQCPATKKWIEKEMWEFGSEVNYRIHPDDAHLQYGPISTEVRKAAENIAERAYLQDLLGHYGIAAIDDYLSRSDEFGYCWDKAMNATAMQKQLFLLILAEALAEEGL